MRLTMKGEYATRAVLYLARNHPQSIIRIQEIADAEQIPFKYLEQILLQLKNSGIVKSKRGLNGGYYLAKPPENISFGDVVRIIDGPLAPVGCVSESAYERCSIERMCGTRGVWLNVRNAIANILDKTTFADVT